MAWIALVDSSKALYVVYNGYAEVVFKGSYEACELVVARLERLAAA